MLALSLLGCASNIPIPGQSQVDWAKTHGHVVSLEELQTGRTLLLQECDGCHALA